MKHTLLAIIAICLTISACKKDDNDDNNNPPTETQSDQNILLVIADDIGIEAIPGYDIGAIKANMPHLSEMAAKGVTFDNVWAYPVCSPTRASILTGRYGYRTGVLNPSDASTISESEKTIQTYLDENATTTYSHALIGKWHLSNDPNTPTNMGIDHYAGVLGGGIPNFYNWGLIENGVTNITQEYCTSKLTDLAIEWIGEQEDPWFCWLAYTAAHTPHHLPPDSMHSQGALSDDEASIEANPSPYFMAMIESIDHELGRLMDNIPADELENTTIIFIGDNGTAANVTQTPYAQNRSKGSLYQGGVHVPMIISGKGVSRVNEREDNLINSTDLFATIAEMAGINLPNYQDSHSFEPTLSAADQTGRSYNYVEVLSDQENKSGYTIRNQQYKLMQLDNGQQRFFDLLNDPYEENNLMMGGGNLNEAQSTALQALVNEAANIRN